MSTRTREIHLVRRPSGSPEPTDFALREVTLADPGPGEVLVRNVFVSVDPYMRLRMNDAESYAAPWALDEAARGGALGEVIASGTAAVPVGALVTHDLGWREHALVSADSVTTVTPRAGVPLSSYLGVLGMTGLTGYAGLVAAAEFEQGDVVFVSGAAGAVGSVAGQIARILGSGRVIGSAGSDEKVRMLTEELGFDAAFNYRSGPPVSELLAQAAPEGIDVYFDNVGGEHLEAAIDSMRIGGRIAKCGSISTNNDVEPAPGPRNLTRFPGKRLTMRGFMVGQYLHLRDEFEVVVSRGLDEGTILAKETITEGLEHMVDAFLGMLAGANTGKALVRVGDDPTPSGHA